MPCLVLLAAALVCDTLRQGDLVLQSPDDVQIAVETTSPPVHWPVAAAWQGHDLLVVEVNWTSRQPVAEQLKTRPHQIVRLRDTNDDGHLDERTIIARDLPFTEGILVLDDSLLVTAPPQILRLSDDDGDGTYERQTPWYDGGTLTYCANDLHGPWMGPEGWVYWTKGAFAEQTYETADGVRTDEAAHVLRRRLEGGPVDIVLTAGMDNPVDLAFFDDGGGLFCGTYFHHPGEGRRDGLAQLVVDGTFGKPHAVLAGAERTGPLLSPFVELGPAAPAAVSRVNAPQWPPLVLARGTDSDATNSEVAALIALAEFNLQRVVLHRLARNGAGLSSQHRELLAGNRVDFHPVDVLEDPRTGDLLVLDTGGWYDLCCPSSGLKGQIAPGGLYRLTCKPPAGTPAESSPHSPIAAFWRDARQLAGSSSRVGDETVPPFVSDAFAAENPSLRRAAWHVAAVWRWPGVHAAAITALDDEDRVVQARAAGVLARLPGPLEAAATEQLLVLHRLAAGDPTLEHACRLALQRRGDAGALASALSSRKPADISAALVAFQAGRDDIDKTTPRLLELLSHSTPHIRKTAGDLLRPTAHELTQADLATLLDAAMDHRDAAVPVLAAALRSPTGATWAGALLEDASSPDETVAALLAALEASAGRELPAVLEEALGRAVWQGSPGLFAALRRLKVGPVLAASLRAFAADDAHATDDRLLAFAALPQRERLPSDLFAAVLPRLLDRDRGAAAALVLERTALDEAAAAELLHHVPQVPASRLSAVVVVLLHEAPPARRTQLLATLEDHSAAATLPREAVLAAIPPADRETWQAALHRWTAPPADLAAAVAERLASLPPGDAVRGHNVFRDARVACNRCHRVGSVGGRIGPELTRIGQTRTPADLLEAILAPSARIEPSYRATRVLTTDGLVVEGLVQHDDDERLELVQGIDRVHRIAKDDIERRVTSDLSTMPAGLEKQLSPQELADLLAFLQSLKNPWD